MPPAENWIYLPKSTTVHLKAEGEICNRLKQGTRVHVLQRRTDWVRITWRGGKKKGWIFLPTSKNLSL